MSTSGANMSHAQMYRAQTPQELTPSLMTVTHGQENQKIITQHREIEDLKSTITRQATEMDTLAERRDQKAVEIIARLKEELEKKDHVIRGMEMTATIGDLRWTLDEERVAKEKYLGRIAELEKEEA